MSIIGTLAAPPATIGRYELRERIAHGGMGVLYLAFDPVTEREVALKVLRVDSDDLRERFLREARLAARLQHPNIVTIYDVGAHEDQPFIAMEFIAGETLGQLVHRRAPLTLSRRIALMEQVCVGLAYAHRHGIVHRDVKPANLMISRDSGVLKVLDFGVAGRVDADPGAAGPDAHGDAELHVPRAGRRAAVGPPERHLFGRAGALRAPHLPPGLQWRVPAVDSLEGAERVAPAARRPGPGHRPGAAGDRRPRAREVGRAPLPRSGGDAVGPVAGRPARPRGRDRRTTWSAAARSPPAVEGEPAGPRPAARRRAGPPPAGAAPEPRPEPTSELRPEPGSAPAPGAADSSRTSRRRWPRPSATPTRAASPPRSAGSRRSDRTPTSTPRCSTTARPSPPATRPAPRAPRG